MACLAGLGVLMRIRIVCAVSTGLLGIVGASGAQAQEASAPTAAAPAPAPDAPSHPPEVAALVRAIEEANEGDLSAEPAAELQRLLDLCARVEANGQVPPIERGLLASALGGVHFYLNDYASAARELGEAARLFAEGDAPPDEIAGLYNNQATVLASMGELDEAFTVHSRALAIRKQIEGGRGKATSSSLFGLGYVLYRQGRVEESIPYFRNSIEQQLEFAGADDPLTIMRMTSLASVLGRSGREAESLIWARRAEELGRAHLGDEHPTYGIALNNLGIALIENGSYQEAIPVLRETLRVRLQTVGEAESGTAISLRNLATALKMTGVVEEAEELNRRAIAIFEASGETDTPDALGYMYSDLADFAARRREWTAYDEYAAQAMGQADARLGEDDHNRAQVHLYHADKLRQRGMVAEALAIAERWVPVMRANLIAQHKDRLWAEALLINLRGRSGIEARGDFDSTVAALSESMADLGVSDRQRARDARTNREAALLLFDVALALADDERAFVALQLANISDLALGQQFGDAGTGADAGGALDLLRRFADVARQADELSARQAAAIEAREEAAIAALGEKLELATAERDRISGTLASEYPEFLARYRPRPVALADMQARLGADDVLLAPLEGDFAGWAVQVTRDSFAAHPFDLTAMRDHVRAIRGAVDGAGGGAPGAFPLADAAALHGLLLPGGIGTGQRLLVHGGQTLASLPMGLLLTRSYAGPLVDAPWLLRIASVQVVGNLALFGTGRSKPDAATEQIFAGVGGVEPPGDAAAGGVQLAGLFRSGRPALDTIADLPPLPSADAELRRIAEALPGDGDLLLVGADAAEERFKRADLSRARVIAFATHGLVAGQLRDLWEPALLLGTRDPASGEDGLLGASEIARLELSADFVILSACNTAAGADGSAPAYSGLAAAFAQAGARSLMLSHWRVRDDAASSLSVGTVRRAATGMGKAEALRQAQLALMADSGVPDAVHPAIWAPFVIVEN